MNSKFIAIDWGTSSFRAYLMDEAGAAITGFSSDSGIAKLSVARQKAYLQQQCLQLSEAPLPLVVCGMVGSTLGLQDAGYLDCPFSLDSIPERLCPMQEFGGWIAPGLRCQSVLGETDVMRGEETQLLGWFVSQNSHAETHTVCLPGTHSKWVQMRGASVASFNTGLTGELNDLLARHSILVSGKQTASDRAFLAGVERSAQGEPLAQTLFSCRSRVLAGDLSPRHTASYLSGLVIGSEVKGQLSYLLEPAPVVTLIGNTELTRRYRMALRRHHIDCHLYSGTDMSIAGLACCFQNRRKQ